MQPKVNLEPNPSSIKHSAVNKNNHQKNSETDLNSLNGVDSDQAIVSSSSVLELDLIYAIHRNEFELYYQPKVNTKENVIIGAEALIRWNHPKLGLISPNDFIPLAEKIGFINDIGKWVKKTACAQNKAWQDAKLPAIPVSINLSASRFMETDLVNSTRETLEQTKLEARYLEIEITETSIMRNEEIVFSQLDALKKLGIKIALDDFGTGYSSLSHLHHFNGKIDILKIDRSFIKDLSNTKQEDANFIVHMILQLSNHLNMDVIAEGVETMEQLKVLQNYNCNTVQGYLFSKPVPANQFAELLKKQRIEPIR
ncbi:EAL domain, c-di-GMP-specific phosphodiesterase class I (or its enzymatically inactive variant) [Psychrobacillus psychrotolerans]|uniref:EAL domain, c-di-GMP-specific phosphodiesterase class I (Or its enzymatically inactive variant) n=1 Tax=Psychrobacillus psychrotolerans TaxID=126156 RepID=A0A1I5Z7J6_9BACI|nr:EAL domain-containing protein [Psychrobacillus psychrotolerans]SFQ52424.1 EAL domain, c-di-GMP-specific phosphodiesterase class I (or its enzymatically inactive variant) [Psychrobacillus psychrotolerans]